MSGRVRVRVMVVNGSVMVGFIVGIIIRVGAMNKSKG